MALSRDQIRKWSERGDPIHAWYSYKTVKDNLTAARLNSMSCAVYLQGSYANKTNIVADSDVDMVIALRSAFYPEKKELSLPEREEYAKHYKSASTTWHDSARLSSKCCDRISSSPRQLSQTAHQGLRTEG